MTIDDHATPDSAELARWQAISTMQEFGDITADWLAGRVSYHPAVWADGPDEETSELVDVLAEINRLGFVTDQSQPGTPPDQLGVQRAFISGFCTEEVALRLRAGLMHTDLVVIPVLPGAVSDSEIVVTIVDGRENTWLGSADSVTESKPWRSTSVGLALLVLDAWQVEVFDPVWGRNDLLWDSVRDALHHTNTGGVEA